MLSEFVVFYVMLAFGSFGAGIVAGYVGRRVGGRTKARVFYPVVGVLYVLWVLVMWRYGLWIGEVGFVLISVACFVTGSAARLAPRAS